MQVKGLRKRKNGRWETQIMHKGKRHYLGTFDTAEQALEARNRRARELSITGATLPSKTPGPNRSKRGTAQPGPLPAGHTPGTAVPPSVPAEHAPAMNRVVYAAPEHAPLPGLLPGRADHQQPGQTEGVDLSAQQPELPAYASHTAGVRYDDCALAGATEPDPGYVESMHTSSVAADVHMYTMPPAQGSFSTAACPDVMAVQSGTSLSPTLDTGAAQLQHPAVSGHPPLGSQMTRADAAGGVLGVAGSAIVAGAPVHSVACNDGLEVGPGEQTVKVCTMRSA